MPDDDRLRALEREFAEFRGEVRAFMGQSSADRSGLHAQVEKADSEADARHKELLQAIADAGHKARNGLQELANAIALERKRIDAFENQAKGAAWAAKWLPGGIGAAVGAALTYFAGGTTKLPPGGMP